MFTALVVRAQQQDSLKSSTTEKKLYVGISLNSTSYMLVQGGQGISGSVEPWITPHIGYNLIKRINLQIGIGYDKDKEHFGMKYYENKDEEELTYWDEYNTTWGIAVPITVQFTPSNPNKRLRLYTNAKFVPVFGSTKIQSVKRCEGVSTVSEREGSGFNAFLIGALLLKYNINSRLDAYVEGNFFYKDLRRNNNYANSRPLSFGLGLDYRFQ